MNNQYNPQQPVPQQAIPQQNTPQQTSVPPGIQQQPAQQGISQQQAGNQQGIPRQSAAQQGIPQQQFNQQYGQPYMQQPVYTKPPKPYVDPAVAKKQKRDALNAFGDKLTDLMNTDPILKIIAAHADLYSFAATALCVLFTVIALLTSNKSISGKTVNAGGEIGGCFIFSLLAIIFGGFSLCKKKILPLTVSMTSVSILMFVRFIVNIVTFATNGSATAGNVINFVFMILEMGGVGYLTYICWTYLLAALPPKAVIQQIYQQSYAAQQNNAQQAQYQQPMQAQQQAQTGVTPAPATVTATQTVSASSPQQHAPVKTETAAANRICPVCQGVNSSDSLFCHKCGTKLL